MTATVHAPYLDNAAGPAYSEIMVMLNQPLRPQFPCTPVCRRCGWIPRDHRPHHVATNRNGNLGRPYYACPNCTSQTYSYSPHVRDRGWITWDDERGIRDSNPLCDCGVVSRQDRAGAGTTMSGLGFWTCATGRCGYFSRYRNGWTDEERMSGVGVNDHDCVEFFPWLL
ncbi:hypothetical protein ASPBRDRAFT_322738 [Aspergillus brasiliensis CBS 101740]|uniref:GRF-like zinc ribbon domain-containing protein n=1 Tax=Aspergillus brasiliensis (strain CBS 101740 / IMI 381727 / IBT 21946) TaxID=767769 RepID=A0A1L9U9J5_ASPBC|nr:hypothetical protein ASPBRDRAFT_322738 [Aspergillus brasiliensis CBS 101740]